LFGLLRDATVAVMPFADDLIGTHTALALTQAMQAVAPHRDLPRLRGTVQKLAPLKLRERSDLLRDALLQDFDGSYAEFARDIRQAQSSDLYFSGWLIWPVTSAVAEKAVQDGSSAAFDDAMALLAALTSRLSSEFAIRTLLRHDLPRALEVIQSTWLQTDDVDVRRLSSEGTRPYLPWAVRVPALMAASFPTRPILDALYRDDSEYVRRSVANHLNDVSRHDAEAVVDTARSWLAAPDANTTAVVRRGLRTLIKQGDPGALELMGFRSSPLEVTGPTLSHDTLRVGEDLTFSAQLTNVGTEAARLSIDYTVHHQKASGRTSGKTFKLAVRQLAPGEATEISKTHSFRPITTRTYYPGTHAIELLINGVSVGRADFQLTEAG
jgi:3-methyladenine DNA glycosylase AlkC